MKRSEIINQIMEQAKPYFLDLFQDRAEATNISVSFEVKLGFMSNSQLEAIADYVKENGMDVNVGHDLAGIYNQDRCFVPRIRTLAAVTPFIS